MLAESEGHEYLAHAEGNAGARLFDAILVGAGKVADANVFNECWRVMRSMGVDPTEGTLEAHMLMESKVGWSEGVETAWERRDAGFEYLHPISKRSPRLFCRRVEAHARIATYLLKPTLKPPPAFPPASSAGSHARLRSAASDRSNALNMCESGATPASCARSIRSRIASESPHAAYALHSVVVASLTSLGCVTAVPLASPFTAVSVAGSGVVRA